MCVYIVPNSSNNNENDDNMGCIVLCCAVVCCAVVWCAVLRCVALRPFALRSLCCVRSCAGQTTSSHKPQQVPTTGTFTALQELSSSGQSSAHRHSCTIPSPAVGSRHSVAPGVHMC